MRKFFKNTALIICVLGLTFVLQACEQEGPAEKTGEKVDNMIEDTQKSLKKAGDKMGDMVEQGGEKLEETGEKMQE